MRRNVAFVMIAVFVVTLGVAILHHHGHEVCLHADCSLCLLLVQPVLSGTSAHAPHHMPSASRTVSSPQMDVPTSIPTGKAFFNRAPPLHVS
jgi:hypothetical protein